MLTKLAGLLLGVLLGTAAAAGLAAILLRSGADDRVPLAWEGVE